MAAVSDTHRIHIVFPLYLVARLGLKPGINTFRFMIIGTSHSKQCFKVVKSSVELGRSITEIA